MILLRRDQKFPFVSQLKASGAKAKEAAALLTRGQESRTEGVPQESKRNSEQLAPNGDRHSRPCSVGEGRYRAVRVKGKARFLLFPLENTAEQLPRGHIDCYDFENYQCERLIDGITSFDLSRDAKTR